MISFQKKVLNQSFLVLGLSLLIAAARYTLDPHHIPLAQVPLQGWEIRLEEATKTIPLWIDARPIIDFEKDHIPNALSLNEDNWEEQFPKILNAWNGIQIIIVYCSSQSCHSSKNIAERIKTSGIKKVFILHGGWESWKAAHP